MAFRFTTKDVHVRFERFAGMMGKRVAKSYNDIGAWRLDHNPVYGGYVIEEIHNAGGAVTQPFGHMRLKAEPFIYAMSFAMDALQIKRGKR